MVILVARIYENVIEIYNNGFVKEVIKKSVHGGLKRCGCVRETEGHDVELICTVPCDECCFVAIGGVDGDLMITGEKVKFSEDGGVCEAVV